MIDSSLTRRTESGPSATDRSREGTVVAPPARATPRRGGRRQQIMQVAADRFRTSGYHNVGINDIADELGLTGPALYRHFRNKQELLRATIENAVDDFVAAYAQPHQDL